jgi:LuxR family maltose regulon positive regulatory protein
MPDHNQILLQTKLHRPRLPKDLITRWRLVEWLNHDIDHPLILVCAPAGFGKTTLIVNWLERMAAEKGEKAAYLPSAWLSLDENDSDLNLFLRYFIAALRTIFSEACAETLALLQARRQPPLAVLYNTFINEIEELPGEAILVLDDYQLIHGRPVHNLLVELTHHWPKPLHLVLISRVDPPLPLTALRPKGMLREIRTRDLRFTPEETSDYLSRTQFALMGRDALPLLEERFEGWPAGLKLAAISFRSADSQEAVLSALSGKNPNITGYLLDEVLTHQLPAIHSFLLKTSILNRFCASLCEAVVEESDPAWTAGACLDWIERSELFLIPLDDRREWYRYHHLFQESLQQRASAEMAPDQVAHLHRRASTWFEEHGLLDDALQHALAAGDIDLAASYMGAGLREAVNLEDRPTLERWLRLLPEEVIQRDPWLLMIRVWALEFSWRLDLQAQTLQQVEALLASETGAGLSAEELKILRGQILALRAQQAYFFNQQKLAIDFCHQALALLPPSWSFPRYGAMIYLGLSMQASGQALEAERLLLTEYESCGDKTSPYALDLLLPLCFNYVNNGRLEQAKRLARVMFQAASQGRVAIQKNWADWFLGVVHYQQNELQAAAQHFSQIIENRYTAQITTYRDAVAGLALCHQIKGERAEARRMVELISQYDLEQSGIEDERTRSLRARLMLLQGDLEGAGNWVDSLTEPLPDMAILWLEEPQVTRAHALIARGTEGDLQMAQQILDVLEDITDRTHNTRFKIEVLALRALALEALGETTEANSILKQALELAYLGGFIRVFVDLGAPMQKMLRRLEEQGLSVEMIQRVLAGFPAGFPAASPAEVASLVGGESPAPPRHSPPPGNSTLAEPLTPRELDVLILLREPLSTKEIAQKLYIAHATARRHTINIYGKLGVNRRWDAVTRAEELNLLPPR